MRLILIMEAVMVKKEIKNGLNIICIETIMDAFKHVFEEKTKSATEKRIRKTTTRKKK